MKRRLFLQSLAALAAVPSRAAADAPWKLNYMLASCMYGDLPLATILPEVKKCGAPSIDLWPRKHGTQREEIDAIGHDKFAEMLKEHEVTLGCMTRYDLGPFKLGDEIGVTQKLGGSIIVTGGAGNHKLEGDALKAEVQGFVDLMKPHAAKAAAAGVTIAIENHVNNVIDTPDSLRWLADMTRNIEGIGIALAPAHLPQDGEVLAGIIRDIGSKMTLFYAWQRGKGFTTVMPKAEELEQMPGRGALDFKPLVAALKEIQFTGPTEVFMHPTPRGIPILPTAAETTAEIVRGKEYLDGLAA